VKLRCDLNINGGSRKLLLIPGASETGEHVALRLAACLLFWDLEARAEISPDEPALADFEFLPDVLALDESGAARVWVQCGKLTPHKAEKLTRRLPYARLVVLLEDEAAAWRQRRELTAKHPKGERFEILAWPGKTFAEWTAALRERTEVYGEAGGGALNLVVNDHPLAVDFKSF